MILNNKGQFDLFSLLVIFGVLGLIINGCNEGIAKDKAHQAEMLKAGYIKESICNKNGNCFREWRRQEGYEPCPENYNFGSITKQQVTKENEEVKGWH